VIEITVYGSEESRRRLSKFARAMAPESRTVANAQAGVKLHSDVIETFIAEGATFGRAKWEDLKAGGRYVKSVAKGKKRRFQTSYQILQDTGALRQSFVPLSDDKLAGVGAVSFYSPVDREDHGDLAKLHQFGVPSKNLPARPMLPTESRALEVVSNVYGRMIEKAAQP